jgi:ribonuclease HI
MKTILIHFDGGCRPTNPGNKYGSFEVTLNSQQLFRRNRVELGWGTNNEAEFEMLLMALDWSVNSLIVGGFNLRDFAVVMFTDSIIVSNRISGRNRTCKSEPQQRMFDLSERCLSKIRQFRQFTIHWEGRTENLKRFGH